MCSSAGSARLAIVVGELERVGAAKPPRPKIIGAKSTGRYGRFLPTVRSLTCGETLISVHVRRGDVLIRLRMGPIRDHEDFGPDTGGLLSRRGGSEPYVAPRQSHSTGPNRKRRSHHPLMAISATNRAIFSGTDPARPM